MNRHRRHVPSVLPTRPIVLVTAGLGAVLLFWFAKHTIQSGLADIWREGAFLLDEGTRLIGGFETARLSGLTIASAVVCASSSSAVCYTLTRKRKTIAIGITMPIMMSVYAYRASYVWMSARRDNLPTLLQ